MKSNTEKREEDILKQPVKAVGQAYFLSEDRAHDIVGSLKAPTLSPLSSYSKKKDQGRSVISSFITQIEVFMSTAAKTGLIVLVLGLLGVFGYTQLGINKNSGEYAMNSEVSEESQAMSGDTSAMAVAETPTGDIDELVSVILAEATSESLALAEEESDVALINAGSQELQDFSQSINEYDL